MTPARAVLLVVAAALVAGAVTLATLRARTARAELPVLATVPAFSLIDHTARPFAPADLRGAPWIANFIFTRCPTICPALTNRMGEVQRRTEGAPVRLVSFSVDPDHDTPQVLAEYARAHGAGPRWSFVTGDFAAMRGAIEDGLKVSMGRGQPGPVIDPSQVLHGAHFALVDGEGRIRGYFDVGDDAGLERLVAAARSLAR